MTTIAVKLFRWVAETTILLSVLALPLLAQADARSAERERAALPETDERRFYRFQTAPKRLMLSTNGGFGLGFRSNNATFVSGDAIVNAMFTPKVGYFVKQGWAVGPSVDLFVTVVNLSYEEEYYLFYYNAGGFTRYYHKSGFFGEAQFGFGSGYEREVRGNSVAGQEDFAANQLVFGAGFANFWLKRANFELELLYATSWGEFTSLDRSFYLNGLNFRVGVSFATGKDRQTP